MSEHVVIRHAFGTPPVGHPADFMVGDALVQPSLNRISLRGQVSQVEPKVMQVLTLMAARPGTVVPREVFLEQVWPRSSDDYLLNRSISELRKILDDDAQAPRCIETIRKTGYRLIAPIAPARVAGAVPLAAGTDTVADTGPAGAASSRGALLSPQPTPANEATSTVASEGNLAASAGGHVSGREAGRETSETGIHGGNAARPAPWRRLLLVALACAALVAVAWLWRSGPTPAPPTLAGPFETRPLTSFLGSELEPALSPDGSRVAFVWDHDADGTPDLHVKAVGSESTLRLTGGEAPVGHPVWSHDGSAILFARPQADGVAILRVSAVGGGATRLLLDATATDLRGMSLSPDGATLAYARRPEASAPYAIALATLATGRTRVLTHPDAGTLGDIDPLFASDGHTVYFVRAVNEVTKDLHAAPLDGGAVTQLTNDHRKINGLTWSLDGTDLLFTSTRSGMYGVWSIDPAGGAPRPVALGDEDVHQPSSAPAAGRVAYERWTHRAQLQRLDLARQAPLAAEAPAQSTRWDSSPAYSPDGRRIAFNSNRTGPQGIWTSARDGRDVVQIATFDGVFVDHPAWSPDGATIAFDASPDGRTAIYTVAADGGTPRRVTDGAGDSRQPAWSRDGRWLYFESNRSGAWQLYAQPAGGGDAVPVTTRGGAHATESVDGHWLLYSKPDAPGLWRQPRRDWAAGGAGAQETRLTDALALQDGGNWAAADEGVYFVRRPADGPPHLARLDTHGATRDVMALTPSLQIVGLDLAPDGRELILAHMLASESDLRLASPREAVAATP